MGLTIHYEIHTRKRTSKSVREVLEDIHAQALKMKDAGVFRQVEDLIHLNESEIEAADASGDLYDHEYGAEIFTAEDSVYYTLDDKVGYHGVPERGYVRVKPLEMFAFSVNVGLGSEWAIIGLARYPEKITVSPREVGRSGKEYEIPVDKRWRWRSFTKTQYAGRYSKLNFLNVHVGLCALLAYIEDHPGTTKVRVNDEGDFYNNRDLGALSSEVENWDNLIAAFTQTLEGVVKDSDSGVSLSAPILEYDEFALMALKGQMALGRNVSQEASESEDARMSFEYLYGLSISLAEQRAIELEEQKYEPLCEDKEDVIDWVSLHLDRSLEDDPENVNLGRIKDSWENQWLENKISDVPLRPMFDYIEAYQLEAMPSGPLPEDVSLPDSSEDF